MSYRYRFHAIPKSIIEEIKNCRTNEEYVQVCKNHQFSVSDSYCAPYRIGKEIHDFGERIYFYDEVEKCQLLFSSDELNKEYSDYNVRICTKATFEAAIQSYADCIRSAYEDLFKEQSPYPWDRRTQFERLLSNAYDHYDYWSNPWLKPYNLDMKTEKSRQVGCTSMPSSSLFGCTKRLIGNMTI